MTKMPKMEKIQNPFLFLGRDEQFLGGTPIKKSRKYVNKI
jgi:hypothetical protein